MAADLLPMLARAGDANNSPLSGAQWYFYESGTTTPQAVYADAALTTSLGAVVTADSAGKFPPIYFDASLTYRGVLKDASGAETLFDIDPINTSSLSAVLADLASTDSGKGAALVTHLPGSTGAVARNTQLKLRDWVSLKDFGPCGNGDEAEDWAAFQAATASLVLDGRGVPVDPATYGGLIYPYTSIFIPPGDYRLPGGLGSGLNNLGFWAIPNTVTIAITDDTYLFEIPNLLYATLLSGLKIIGGKGALHHTFTGTNVTRRHWVQDCVFIDYTECAICSDAGNMPYWKIRDNEFYGLEGADTKGLCLGGLIDNAAIDNNSFLRNKTHLQIGPLKSGSANVVNNDFFSFTPDYTDRDIWIIPNDALGDFGTNSGQAILFDNNKFGNELLGEADPDKKAPRVLIAAASITAGNRATAAPDFTWKNGADGANWLRHIQFTNNRISTSNMVGLDGPDASFCRIYCEKVDNILFEGNPIDGGRFNYLFEHIDGGARRSSKDNTSSVIRLLPERDRQSAVRYGISNRVMGWYEDANGAVTGPHAMLPGGVVDPGAATIGAITAHTGWAAETGVTLAAGTDRDGGSTAAEITFSATNQGVNWPIAVSGGHLGKTGWLGLDIGKAGSDPVSGLLVRIDVNHSSGTSTMVNQTVPVPDDFEPSYFRFDIPDDATAIVVYIRAPYAAAGADKIVLGNAVLASGRSAPAMP